MFDRLQLYMIFAVYIDCNAVISNVRRVLAKPLPKTIFD
jgi:hypothetical protein